MSLTQPQNDREQMQYGLGLLDGLSRARQVVEESSDDPFNDPAELLYVLDQESDAVIERYKSFVRAVNDTST